MSVIGDIRKEILSTEEFLFGGEIDCRAVAYIVQVLDAYEAAHPGLVDETEPCYWCGTPTFCLGHYDVKEEFIDDETGWVSVAYTLCPECAKREEKHE